MNTASAARADLNRLGRYHLLERIGGGATSVVYAAHDDAMDRQVAVKMIVADLVDEREARERFYREAKVTAQLFHPNIVSVIDAGEDQGRPFIVMELLKGLPLPEFLVREPNASLATKLGLITQLFEGLRAAHDSGVVHRDIKPSNLFVQQDGCLKILDFGLARHQTSTLTATGQIVGTPDFMSPEQAAGAKVDVRSDIFSAAAVAYLMLTGRAPFTGLNLRETLERLLDRDPVPIDVSQAPEPLIRIVCRGLAKRAADRYQTCVEVLDDLKTVPA